MKILKVFYEDKRANIAAIMTDGTWSPYVIVRGLNKDENEWDSAVGYYHDFLPFVESLSSLVKAESDSGTTVAQMTVTMEVDDDFVDELESIVDHDLDCLLCLDDFPEIKRIYNSWLTI